MRQTQLSLLKKPKFIHGGATAKGNPREARPISLKRPTHLVMRSMFATGKRSMITKENNKLVTQIIEKHAKLCGVKIYDFANGGNHLHLVVRPTNRRMFAKFLRVITGLIARAILKAEKARGFLKGGKKFWDARPFTRVADWGRSYDVLKSYLAQNRLEALGFIKWAPRDRKRRRVYVIQCEPVRIRIPEGWLPIT